MKVETYIVVFQTPNLMGISSWRLGASGNPCANRNYAGEFVGVVSQFVEHAVLAIHVEALVLRKVVVIPVMLLLSWINAALAFGIDRFN